MINYLLATYFIKRRKVWTFHTSHKFFMVRDDKEHTFQAQLFSIGICGIINNDPALMKLYTPDELIDIEKELNESFNRDIIRGLGFENPITITTDEDGLYIEVTNED